LKIKKELRTNWKYNIWKIEIKGWNWKQIKYLQSDHEEKLEIKRKMTKFKIPRTKRIKLSF